MPLLKGSATFSRYRVTRTKKRFELGDALRAHAFTPLDLAGPEERAHGFVEAANRDATELTPGALHAGESALFAYRIDEVKLPSAVVKAGVEEWARKFEEENGRKPGRKEKADAKAEVRHTLRARFPLATRTFEVTWDLSQDLLCIWAGSRKMIDEVQAALEKALPIELVAVVPQSVAARLELDLESLKPTPALQGGLHVEA